VRVTMWEYLVLLLGPPMVVIWVAGLRALWRDPRLRFLVVVFAVVVVFTFVSGTQAYYPMFFLPVPFAAGIVAMERHLARVWGVLFAINGLVAGVLGLPVVPLASVGSTPVADVNQTVADSVGWPEYAHQVGAVYDALPDRRTAVVYASNYGEAGAVHRYLPGVPVFSAQNGLYDQARPPADAATVVVVGGQWGQLHRLFGTCRLSTRLDNHRDVPTDGMGCRRALPSAPSPTRILERTKVPLRSYQRVSRVSPGLAILGEVDASHVERPPPRCPTSYGAMTGHVVA
jgi:hypothetical protein